MGTKADKRARRLAAEMSDNFKRNEDMEGWTMKRALKWLRDNADAIGIGCMWFVAATDLVILRKLDDACVWALFAIVCTVQNRHRAELDRLRIEANVTKELLGAIVTEQDRATKCVQIWTDAVDALHLKIDRVEGAMLKGKGN